jgi:hypothetical protein
MQKNSIKTKSKRCLIFDENEFSTLQIILVNITGNTIAYNKKIDKMQAIQHPLMLQKPKRILKENYVKRIKQTTSPRVSRQRPSG